MPRRAVPVARLLALSAVALVAMTGSSLASGTADLRRPGPAGDADIHASLSYCAGKTGAAPKANGRQCTQVTATGFLPGEAVRVREFRRPGWQLTVRADGHGRVGCRLPPARDPHADVLTFVGLGPLAPARTAGTVAVGVPRIAVFHIGPRAGR